jgi:hypothetical protein
LSFALEPVLDCVEVPVPDFGGERADFDAGDAPVEVVSPVVAEDLDRFGVPDAAGLPETGMVEHEVTNGRRTSNVHPSFFVRQVLKCMFINVRVSFK